MILRKGNICRMDKKHFCRSENFYGHPIFFYSILFSYSHLYNRCYYITIYKANEQNLTFYTVLFSITDFCCKHFLFTQKYETDSVFKILVVKSQLRSFDLLFYNFILLVFLITSISC